MSAGLDMEEFPSSTVVVRFGTNTPFWVLSMSYGIFVCPTLRKTFHSPDQFVAFHMLNRPEDRARIMKTPNGYLAHNNLQYILQNATYISGSPVVNPAWEQERDEKMHYCLQLKYSQSAVLADALIKTGERPIVDDSRNDELHWCHASGRGKDVHGKMLEKVRAELLSGELLPMVMRTKF